MIINTGMRTDIPAYFSDWFFNRIKEGYVLVRNPYNPTNITRYRLSADIVDCICFCTKNPKPMLDRINEIDKFGQFWFVTITPYGKDIEPYVPPLNKVIEYTINLSNIVGKNALGWRYDPIFVSDRYSVEYHIRAFEYMASKLCHFVDSCVISFIDLYEKTKKNFAKVRPVTKYERLYIGRAFANIGQKYGIQIRSCCEKDELDKFGIESTGCMTKNVIEKAISHRLYIPKSKQYSRQGCNCLLSNDIGVYNTCGHGCLYCYANYDRKTVVQNMRLHDPHSPLLIGNVSQFDNIIEAKQYSYIDNQLTLF